VELRDGDRYEDLRPDARVPGIMGSAVEAWRNRSGVRWISFSGV